MHAALSGITKHIVDYCCIVYGRSCCCCALDFCICALHFVFVARCILVVARSIFVCVCPLYFCGLFQCCDFSFIGVSGPGCSFLQYAPDDDCELTRVRCAATCFVSLPHDCKLNLQTILAVLVRMCFFALFSIFVVLALLAYAAWDRQLLCNLSHSHPVQLLNS